jgi:hypothetical protein
MNRYVFKKFFGLLFLGHCFIPLNGMDRTFESFSIYSFASLYRRLKEDFSVIQKEQEEQKALLNKIKKQNKILILAELQRQKNEACKEIERIKSEIEKQINMLSGQLKIIHSDSKKVCDLIKDQIRSFDVDQQSERTTSFVSIQLPLDDDGKKIDGLFIVASPSSQDSITYL